MNSNDFKKRQLKYKKDKVIQTVSLAREYCKLSKPYINFDGCPLEGANGPENGHYHTGGVNKICISERQMQRQSMNELENTCIHEVIHHLGLLHDSSDEKAYFERIKNYVKSNVWKPQTGGSQFITAEQNREADERIRQDPKRLAKINEDSDYIKFIEGRPTSSMKEQSEKQKPKTTKREKAPHKERTSTPYKSLSKTDIEEARKKLGIKTEEDRPTPKLDDKEHEKLTNKAYENMDTGFGDKHGENRWNKKKKGLLGRIKDVLGIK
jgi:hypothetical protein